MFLTMGLKMVAVFRERLHKPPVLLLIAAVNANPVLTIPFPGVGDGSAAGFFHAAEDDQPVALRVIRAAESTAGERSILADMRPTCSIPRLILPSLKKFPDRGNKTFRSFFVSHSEAFAIG